MFITPRIVQTKAPKDIDKARQLVADREAAIEPLEWNPRTQQGTRRKCLFADRKELYSRYRETYGAEWPYDDEILKQLTAATVWENELVKCMHELTQ